MSRFSLVVAWLHSNSSLTTKQIQTETRQIEYNHQKTIRNKALWCTYRKPQNKITQKLNSGDIQIVVLYGTMNTIVTHNFSLLGMLIF